MKLHNQPRRRTRLKSRTGAAVVEFAFVAIFLGIVVGGHDRTEATPSPSKKC